MYRCADNASRHIFRNALTALFCEFFYHSHAIDGDFFFFSRGGGKGFTLSDSQFIQRHCSTINCPGCVGKLCRLVEEELID